MASNDIRNKTASIYIDDQPAIDAYNRLIPKADAYNKKIDEGTKKAEFLQKAIQKSLDAGGKPEALQKKLANVNKELDNNRKALEKVNVQQKELQQRINSGVGPSLKEQAALVRKLENEYLNLGNNTDAARKKLIEYEQASGNLNKMRERLDAVKNAAKDSTPNKGIFSGAFWGSLAGNLVAKATSVISNFFNSTIDEALQAEESTARFKASLDNIGRSDAFERLTNKAKQVAKEFTYLDNDDVVAVFEKLIDYGKLTEQQMNDLLPVIINFAAKQRISISEASDVIVKALEGNSKGLKRFGIDLSETATPAERLSYIMGDLKDKVEGAGKAFQDTTAGKIASAKQQFKDLAEELGNVLLPLLNKLIDFTTKSIKGLPILARNIGNTFDDVITFFKDGPAAAYAQKVTRDATEKQTLLKQEMNSEEDVLANQYFQKRLTAANDAIAKEKTIADKDKKRLEIIENQRKLLKDGKIKLSADRLAIEKVIVALDNRTLGGGDANADPSGDKEKSKELARQREQERNKITEDYKKLDDELYKLQVDSTGRTESQYMKDLQAAFDKYEKLKELAHDNTEKIKLIERAQNEALSKINKEYADKAIEELKKLDEEKRKLREKQLQDQLKKGFNFLEGVGKDVAQSATRSNQLRKATLDYDISKASGKKQYELEKQKLEEEKQQAIQAAKDKGESVEAVEVYYQMRLEQLEQDRMQKKVEMYQNWANQVFSIFTNLAQMQNSRDNAELNRINQRANAEKANYQRQLNNKLISRQQYERKVAEIDGAVEKRKEVIEKQQFERNKKIQIAQALVNGAMGITSVLAARPGATDIISLGTFRAINIALTIASTAAAVAAIAKSKYEGSSAKFGKGGSLSGPSHKDGGMPVINPRTGRKEAEVEGGEVILSRNTVAKNKALVDALLYNSLYRDGARIDPWFKNRTYKAIDFNGISRSIQNVRHYESGGVFQQSGSSSAAGGVQQPVIVPAMSEQQEALMQALLLRLSVPIEAQVVYGKIEAAKNTIDSIKGDATFGKK